MVTDINAYTTRTTCRLCGGSFRDVLNLGDIYVSDFVDSANSTTPTVPIDLVECVDCHVMQLRDTVNGDVMYQRYWYQSGLNSFMVGALRDVVYKTLEHVQVNAGDIIVDIGANDGTLFSQYPEEIERKSWFVAYEPSNLYVLGEKHAHYVIHDYFNADAYNKKFTRPAKIITSIAMFYDLEDPHTFIEQVKSILAPDGIWTIQLMDLLSMIRTNDFPNLCHEHLEYYTLHNIVSLLGEHNLDVVDVEYNTVNGSSLRVYVAHKNSRPVYDSVNTALNNELDFFSHIGDIGGYFKSAVENVRSGVVAFIKYQRSLGKTVAVMGASTKGNTILQYFNLGPDDICHAAEVNPDKYGKYTIGTNIPIIPETESLAAHPDFYHIIPWGFFNNFIERNQTYLQSGGAFIVPLPEPMIIEYKDGGLHAWRI